MNTKVIIQRSEFRDATSGNKSAISLPNDLGKAASQVRPRPRAQNTHLKAAVRLDANCLGPCLAHTKDSINI